MSSSCALLQLETVSKSFMGVQAVKDLSLEVYPGEILGLIGPNGAGKTTVFNLIAGLLKPDSGSIWFQGQNITQMAAHRVNALGISRTFQNVRLFPRLTVVQNLLWTLGTRSRYGMLEAVFRSKNAQAEDDEAESRVRQLLEEVGLEDKADVQAGSLPYGDQRRLEFVRALSTNPRLLLLDEPTAGMNPTETGEFGSYIRRVASRGVTVMVIEHFMSFVMELCDRIVVLTHGQKIADGNPQEIQADEAVITAYLGRKRHA